MGDPGKGGLGLTGLDGRAEQQARLEYGVPPKDVLVFVPGTTDPINATSAQHQANTGYWTENKPFFDKVRTLRREYLDLHVMDQFYSWSGDNAKAEREKAGDRLRELLYARTAQPPVYAGWKDKPVWLHLVGHSHGGNVINEFTKKIKQHGDFPKKWKIRSITYLSTPFFRTLHQLDTAHFHPECRVINVFNAYDLTQRVVADYTVRQLPAMLAVVNGNADITRLRQSVSSFNTTVFGALKTVVIDDKTEGPALWRETRRILDTGLVGLAGAKGVVADLRRDFPDVMSEKAKGIADTLLSSIAVWARAAIGRLDARLATQTAWYKDVYTHLAYVRDLQLSLLLQAVAQFIHFDRGTLSGPFFDFLDEILLGRIDVFDDTTSSPRAQVPSRYEVIDVPVAKYDPYYRRREAQFARFIQRVEREQAAYAAAPSARLRMSFVLTMLAQLSYDPWLSNGIKYLGWSDWVINDASTEGAIRALRSAMEDYKTELDARNCGIVVPEDRSKPLKDQRGGVAYLSWVSHSVSRMDLYEETRKALVPAFGSGKNPGFLVTTRK